MYAPGNKVGGLTFAFGQAYQRMAYALGLTLKRYDIPLTVVVSQQDVRDKQIFKPLEGACNVVVLPGRFAKFEYEALAYDLSPYDTTVKFDADMIVPAESYLPTYIDLIEKLDLVSGMACDLRSEYNNSTIYRKIESSMDIPTIYSAAFGFTKSELADKFFAQVKYLFKSWYGLKTFSSVLPPTTDSIYSIAWRTVARGIPLDGLPFLHMKPGIAGSRVPDKWMNKIPFVLDDLGRLRVNSHQIRVPFHYYDKTFMTDTLLEKIEQHHVCNHRY